MSATIFEQSNPGSGWRALSRRWLSLQTEKLAQLARHGEDRRGASRSIAPIAHRYLPDGDIEYICMSCFGVVCQVRHTEDALLAQRAHICVSPEAPVKFLRKVI